jgi:uncharacterized membrane protein
MLSAHLANVIVHVTAGALALGAGVVALAAAKGGRLHRKAGRVYAAIGAVSLVTATVGDIFFHPPAPLVAVSLAFAYQYVSGLRALALRRSGPGVIDAAFALCGLAACVALLLWLQRDRANWIPAIGYSTLGYAAFVALYDLSRHFWTRTWLAHARPLDHGLKMTGAYFAMMSGGVGNIFRGLQPWSQVGPSLLGIVVMIALAWAYFAARPGAGRFAVQAPRA